jgi:hypothetical protein
VSDERARIGEKVRLFSAYLDGTYGPDVSAETATWRRVAKIGEEHGEVIEALLGTLGENPRKGFTHTTDDLIGELLDVAGCALGAVEHVIGNTGQSVVLLEAKLDYVLRRAGLAGEEPTPQPSPPRCPLVIEVDDSIGGEGEIACAGLLTISGDTAVCTSGHRLIKCECGARRCKGWQTGCKEWQTGTAPEPTPSPPTPRRMFPRFGTDATGTHTEQCDATHNCAEQGCRPVESESNVIAPEDARDGES